MDNLTGSVGASPAGHLAGGSGIMGDRRNPARGMFIVSHRSDGAFTLSSLHPLWGCPLATDDQPIDRHSVPGILTLTG
jgi:hypothetical protein